MIFDVKLPYIHNLFNIAIILIDLWPVTIKPTQNNPIDSLEFTQACNAKHQYNNLSVKYSFLHTSYICYTNIIWLIINLNIFHRSFEFIVSFPTPELSIPTCGIHQHILFGNFYGNPHQM